MTDVSELNCLKGRNHRLQSDKQARSKQHGPRFISTRHALLENLFLNRITFYLILYSLLLKLLSF